MPEEPQLQSYLHLTVPSLTAFFPSSSASSALSANSAFILIRVFASLLPYFLTSLLHYLVSRPTKNPRKTLRGSPNLFANFLLYNSLRPSIAFNIVTSSAYSKSAPTGIPTPIRVTRTPSGFSSFDT
jgi:hypothetical protein